MLNNINAEIRRHNMTGESLAKELGVSRRTLSNWINEVTELPLSALRKMAIMWDCSTDYLIGIELQEREPVKV